ncbi:MAG: hypothetical protein WCV90_01140 [Candidatus Woesearchaeota archaeon]|jgi:hypothetical protein
MNAPTKQERLSHLYGILESIFDDQLTLGEKIELRDTWDYVQSIQVDRNNFTAKILPGNETIGIFLRNYGIHCVGSMDVYRLNPHSGFNYDPAYREYARRRRAECIHSFTL